MSPQNDRPRAALLLVASLLLGGCAVKPESLRRPAHEQVLQIRESVKWKLGFWDVTLVPGSYVGKFEDDTGTYFMGPPMCVYLAGRPGKEADIAGAAWECGILLPKKPDKQPTVVHIIGTHKPLTVFHADDTPDFSKVKPPAPPPANADAPPYTIMTTAPVSIGAGIVGSAIGGAFIGAMLEAEQGTFKEFNSQPAKGWLVHTPVSASEVPAGKSVP